MGGRGTLLLAIALLAAGAWLYRDVTSQQPGAGWQAVFEEQRPPAPGDQITHLLELDPAAVTAIRLGDGNRHWTVRRGGPSSWEGARSEDVSDFLQALRDLAEVMPLEVGPAELADHGLDPPERSVEVERTGAPPVVLLIGHRNPPATGVYVQLGPGGPVKLTGALLLWEFDKAARSFAPSG